PFFFWGFVSTNPQTPRFFLFHSHSSCRAAAFGKRLERYAQFLNCTKDRVLRSCGARFQNGGDFFNAAAIPMTHDDCGALCGSELLERLLHAKSELTAAGETFWRGGGIFDLRKRIHFLAIFRLARWLFTAPVFDFALADAVDGVIRGDA